MKYGRKEYSLIVNLEYIEYLKRYIPLPYICPILENGKLGSLKAQANFDTISEYRLVSGQDTAKTVIKLTQKLSIANLSEKYCTKKRPENTLLKLLDNRIYQKSIHAYFDRMTVQLLDYLSEHQIPLVEDIVRKTPLEELAISTKNVLTFEPILKFDKTQLGIKYSISLKYQDKHIIPNHYNILILTDNPAYIVVDHNLFRIKHINAQKLQPFLKKAVLFIKDDMVVTYFKQFIMQVAKKVDIEASGFDVVKHQTITGQDLKLAYDFTNGKAYLEVIFSYENESFAYGSKTKTKTQLSIGDDQQISIHQTIRNPISEQMAIAKLEKLGLQQGSNSRLSPLDSEDPLSVVDHLITNRSEIETNGFVVGDLSIGDKQIAIDHYEISMSSHLDNDWFDIKGTIIVGDEEIPFARLIEHIKNGERYVPLESGKYFVIPQAWLTQFSDLAKTATTNQSRVKLRKSQNAILKNLDLEMDTASSRIVDGIAIDYVPSKNLKATLRPYQLEGVKWMLGHQESGLGACLADDMGLGKTLQTIAVLTHTKDQLKRKTKPTTGQMTMFASQMNDEISPLRALIILPASLVFNWISEIRKFNPTLHLLQYHGIGRKNKRDSIDKFDIVITTYHTAKRDIDLLQTVKWRYLVLDESQMIKNKSSKLFGAISKIDATNKISLSGTPIENSLGDLWSQMQVINPGLLGTYSQFEEHYQAPIERHRDIAAIRSLATLVDQYVLRRTKEQVAKDLPSITEQIDLITLGNDQMERYDEIKSAARNQIFDLGGASGKNKIHVFAALTKLRQIATAAQLLEDDYDGSSVKVDYIIDRMDTLRKAGHKVLIFSSFTKTLNLFKARSNDNGWKYQSLTGADNQVQRKSAVQAFQDDQNCDFFFISLKAGGTGLNLTAATYVFIIDPWWNPFAERQAIARAHRIGQDKPVTVVRFIAKSTIEEKILKLQERKQMISDDVMDFNEERIILDQADMDFLLK